MAGAIVNASAVDARHTAAIVIDFMYMIGVSNCTLCFVFCEFYELMCAYCELSYAQ